MRIRLWFEIVLTGVAAILTFLSLVWPTWWESLSGESPDGGDGSFERLLALGWLAVTAVFFVLSRRDWRRLKAAPDPART